MTMRNIAKEILDGLDDFAAWRAGRRTLRTVTVDLPRAADVARIRGELGLSQAAFAAFMGVSVGTLRNWEQLRREPQGPARAFLRVAATQPMAVLAAFERTEVRASSRSAAGNRPSKRRSSVKAASRPA